MGKLIYLENPVQMDIDPDRVLSEAIGKLNKVVIAGWEKNEEGTLYLASSVADGGECLWLIEKLKQQLMEY